MSLSLTSAPGSAAAAGAALNPLIQIRDLIYKIAGIFQSDNKLRLLASDGKEFSEQPIEASPYEV